MKNDLVFFRPIPELKHYQWNGKPRRPESEWVYENPEKARTEYAKSFARWNAIKQLMEADFSRAQETWPWDMLMLHHGHVKLKYHTGITREVVG